MRKSARFVWIEERDALTIHNQLLALDGGPAGVRNNALLLSALACPQQLQAYDENPDIIDLAAAYTVGIIRNHPFVDGNKRTGFVVGLLFLEIDGHKFTATEEGAAQAVLSLASGTLDEPGFVAWMRGNTKRR